MKKALSVLLLVSLVSGCAFSGKRTVSLDMNLLGNTIKWKSTVDGGYVDVEEPLDAEAVSR
jgi:hypothetical protein